MSAQVIALYSGNINFLMSSENKTLRIRSITFLVFQNISTLYISRNVQRGISVQDTNSVYWI
jgi:hypothetical protein